MNRFCFECEIEGLSDCCNAPIILSDICSRCKEHCESACKECRKMDEMEPMNRDEYFDQLDEERQFNHEAGLDG